MKRPDRKTFWIHSPGPPIRRAYPGSHDIACCEPRTMAGTMAEALARLKSVRMDTRRARGKARAPVERHAKKEHARGQTPQDGAGKERQKRQGLRHGAGHHPPPDGTGPGDGSRRHQLQQGAHDEGHGRQEPGLHAAQPQGQGKGRDTARASPAAHSNQLSAFSSDCVVGRLAYFARLACSYVQEYLWRNCGAKHKRLYQKKLFICSRRKKKLRPHSIGLPRTHHDAVRSPGPHAGDQIPAYRAPCVVSGHAGPAGRLHVSWA
jgi:hypothetical protein